ncbi:hypothetical protein E2C01_032322 [Portunus trituberculatus]|uniref:Ig-like domain-containing protein n=1 Tax=Portunus trituberculatus TaxID=210409 RepID=A0A5B7F0G0_PORTR|nr:hypothetical protein [Portunus trituberculatus]
MSVRVSGPGQVLEGDPVTLTCVTNESNPPASVRWKVQEYSQYTDSSEGSPGPSFTCSVMPHMCISLRPARLHLLKEIQPFSVLFCRGDCYFLLGEENPYGLGGLGHDLRIDPPRGDVTQGIRGHGGVPGAQPCY